MPWKGMTDLCDPNGRPLYRQHCTGFEQDIPTLQVGGVVRKDYILTSERFYYSKTPAREATARKKGPKHNRRRRRKRWRGRIKRRSGLPYPSSLRGKNFENHKISRTGQQVSGQRSEPRNSCKRRITEQVTCHVYCPVSGRPDAGSHHFRKVSQGHGARLLGYLKHSCPRCTKSQGQCIPVGLRDVTASSELQALT